MGNPDFARVVAEFRSGSALLVEPGSSAAAHVPPRWAEIARHDDPGARRAAAIALWNLDVLVELLPRFGAVLNECLDDVRVCLLRGDWVLLYALRKPFQPYAFRIGWDPGTFGADLPPYWERLPKALRVFLDTVHAGFTDLDGISFGPTRPRDMRTYRTLNIVESVRNWEAAEDIPGDRALLIAKGLGQTRYFVSPDLPGGTIGWEAGGHLERPLDFAHTFDELMSYGFELDRDRVREPAVPAISLGPQALRSVPPIARAVVWDPELTEDAARDRIRDLVADLLRALGGQMRIRTQEGLNGEMILPFDDDAGNIYHVDRLETRYFLEPPDPDRTDIYPPVIIRIWERHGWEVTLATDANGIVAQARTPDWYELTLTHHTDTLRLAVASPGFRRPS
ncbi:MULTISPECIES: hypothetical protein [unclassified Nocardia]|uniref:hypothetical protein n=1 Tax=unclassified Nocardia TaxID=2637762 RepID=UPI001CE3F912|nr:MULTISPECIES: hypothetical protein [unclassified Nocardia]